MRVMAAITPDEGQNTGEETGQPQIEQKRLVCCRLKSCFDQVWFAGPVCYRLKHICICLDDQMHCFYSLLYICTGKYQTMHNAW